MYTHIFRDSPLAEKNYNFDVGGLKSRILSRKQLSVRWPALLREERSSFFFHAPLVRRRHSGKNICNFPNRQGNAFCILYNCVFSFEYISTYSRKLNSENILHVAVICIIYLSFAFHDFFFTICDVVPKSMIVTVVQLTMYNISHFLN